MAHVFIVDDNTFQTHLKYMFAGTGAKDFKCDFLIKKDFYLHSSRERLLAGMIADISRIKIGDSVLFYLQQTTKHEGMFFGRFKVAEKPFYSQDNYLLEELGKNLTFRVKLIASDVYPIGITERSCLDDISEIKHPSEMCWSLIYRKLKGNRGCTMITNAEENYLMNKIKKINKNTLSNGKKLGFNIASAEIVESDESQKYVGIEASLNIKNRLFYKYENNAAYETHLQAYVLQNLENINNIKVNSNPIVWIGNEVSCGVGMQSIDIVFIQENNYQTDIVICELKDEQPTLLIEQQVRKYIEWFKQYIIPTYNDKVTLHPVIIAPKPNAKTKKTLEKIDLKTDKENYSVENLKYVSFSFEEEQLMFEKEEI